MASTVSISEFDHAVAAFKKAWERADSAGLSGHRVENGIQELINLGWRPAATVGHERIAIYDGNEHVCTTCPRNSYGEHVAWDLAHPSAGVS